tara:strand:- start:61 stop:963 length:903 start_codon:yes stop_codon:yes gene_type:complete
MKASNIYQKLKSAGVGNPDGVASKKPAIKGLGSPAKFAPPKEVVEKAKTKIQQNKNAEARKAGKAVSYKDAYADADKKKYKTYEEFEKAAKKYNRDKYDSENPTSEAKKQGISKEKLAENVKNKKNPPANDDPKPSNTEDPKPVKSTEVTVKSRKQNRADKRIARLSEKAKKKGSLTKGQRRRLAVAEEKSAGKSGKDARLAANEKLNKKDDSALAMKKGSAMKMGKSKSPMKMSKKGAPAKMSKSPNKFNKGLKKAAADGKLDKNPKFKAAVENAPAKMKKSAMKMGMKKSAAKMKYKK